jgi:hypothetical protein
MLSALSEEKVDFLLIGAYAMAVHGLPRATGDMDLWVRASAERVLRALERFGAPLFDLTRDDLTHADTVFQIGVAPRRIDVLTSIDGVAFEDAWQNREEKVVEGLRLNVIGRKQLIANKRATGRPRDLADALWLEAEA